MVILFWMIDNLRFHNAELGHKLLEPFAIIALELTVPIEIHPHQYLTYSITNAPRLSLRLSIASGI
jgi:hypothetical protein